MNIPYTYLAVLLVFTLLVGVVIGDRLAAGAGVGVDGYGYGYGPGRAGSCTGLASARLHGCVHRYGYLPAARRSSTDHSGGRPWDDPSPHTDPTCGLAGLDE